MAIDDRSRHELVQRLDEVLGPQAADTLMSHLPPVGWADVATKRDLDALEERMDLRFERTEERLIARLNQEIGGLRQEMTESNGSIRQDIGAVRQETAKANGSIHQEIGSLQAEFANQTRQIMFAMIGLIFTTVLLTYTAARFG